MNEIYENIDMLMILCMINISFSYKNKIYTFVNNIFPDKLPDALIFKLLFLAQLCMNVVLGSYPQAGLQWWLWSPELFGGFVIFRGQIEKLNDKYIFIAAHMFVTKH